MSEHFATLSASTGDCRAVAALLYRGPHLVSGAVGGGDAASWMFQAANNRHGIEELTMSKAVAKKPRKDSVAWRVVDFLEANPSEELTRHDVAAKFDIDPVQVDDALKPVVSSGHIVRELNADSVSVWRLNFTRTGVPKPFALSVGEAKKAVRAERRPPISIDFASLVIEEGIPLVVNHPQKRGQWDALFGRMRPGDSFQLTLEARDALSHAQYNYRKQNPSARFTIRKTGPEHCRIWRLE